MPKASPAKTRKPTLSPTRILTYLDCAVKYKYIYQDKLGRFFLKAKPQLSFGSTLHNVLQTFHEQGAAHTPEEMVTALETQWISAGYTSKEEEQKHKETGEQIVQAYHTAHQERVIAQVETIATEKTITCDLGDFKLSGRVDRIDRHTDGTLEIIDYKSGRWEVTQEQVYRDFAMRCYQLILSDLYPDTPIQATIYCLRSGISATAMLETEERDLFREEILALGDEIIYGDYSGLIPEPIEMCPECEFLRLCKRYWTKEKQKELIEESFSEEGI